MYGEGRPWEPYSEVEMGLTTRRGSDPSVVWTRGRGCAELAELLGGGAETRRIQGDLVQECIDHRADLLISRKLPGTFDLVSVAIPVDFQPAKVTSVVATVAGGPHSLLAAEIADRLGSALDVEAEMVSATRLGGYGDSAQNVLDQLGSEVPKLRSRVVEVGDVGELAETLDEGTLLILGAPGGSWLQRAMLGPGARLRRTAQAGAIVVRSAPDRVFRFMGEPVYVAPLRLADDTVRMHSERTLAVADQGRLIGLVRRERLLAAGGVPVESFMEEAMSVRVHGTLTEAWELEPTFGSDPIPVTDDEEHLVGGLTLPVG